MKSEYEFKFWLGYSAGMTTGFFPQVGLQRNLSREDGEKCDNPLGRLEVLNWWVEGIDWEQEAVKHCWGQNRVDIGILLLLLLNQHLGTMNTWTHMGAQVY